MTRFASRKFLLALAALISAHVLCALGHISDGVYSAVLLGCVGGYLAANVTQRATAKGAT